MFPYLSGHIRALLQERPGTGESTVAHTLKSCVVWVVTSSTGSTGHCGVDPFEGATQGITVIPEIGVGNEGSWSSVKHGNRRDDSARLATVHGVLDKSADVFLVEVLRHHVEGSLVSSSQGTSGGRGVGSMSANVFRVKSIRRVGV